MNSQELMSVISRAFAPLEVSLESGFEDLEATSVLLLRQMVIHALQM